MDDELLSDVALEEVHTIEDLAALIQKLPIFAHYYRVAKEGGAPEAEAKQLATTFVALAFGLDLIRYRNGAMWLTSSVS